MKYLEKYVYKNIGLNFQNYILWYKGESQERIEIILITNFHPLSRKRSQIFLSGPDAEKGTLTF